MQRSTPVMTVFGLLVLLVAADAVASGQPPSAVGTSHGSTCAVCTIALGLVEGLADVHNKSAGDALAFICDILPDKIRPGCKELVDLIGPIIIPLIEDRETPDVVCKAVRACDGQCHLFPLPAEGLSLAVARVSHSVRSIDSAVSGPALAVLRGGLPAICKLPGFKEVCDLIDRFANDHDPLDDRDQDGFSDLHTFRGADWRGKDCDDSSADRHPGALPIDSDVTVDSNCNGIFGTDVANGGTPYEELFCNSTPPMGTVVLGDSASAHFHVPEAFLDATKLNNDTFKHLIDILANEFDWPMLSASTGFDNSSNFAPDVSGPVNSTYQVMRTRNLCSHRDFQNIAVNGARAGAMNSTILQSMSRIQDRDQPVLLIYALIGNDVCNGHEDTLADMTTPAEMRASVLGALAQLEGRLPLGSHVVLTGLADGRILYENLATRIHPLGRVHNDVTYADVYEFLNCNSLSPCRGWMNKNATLRNLTTDRAVELSQVLENITHTEKYTHFDLAYTPNPLATAIPIWIAEGREVWELIEPIDGFHPNQFAQGLITEVFWRYLAQEHPGMMPPVNLHNKAIRERFGDQGGY